MLNRIEVGTQIVPPSDWEHFMREMHEMLGTTRKCFILACGSDPKVALVGLKSQAIHFYCCACAEELITTSLFRRVE